VKTTGKGATVAVLAATLMTGNAERVFAESRLTADSPTIMILVMNHAGIGSDVLAEAQEVASEIYAAAGVKVVWTQPSTAPSLPSKFRLTMMIISKATLSNRSEASGVLGIAPGVNGSGRTTIAYAFHERIDQFARERGLSVAATLGCVMAHETGHLLLGRHSHSKSGLMRAVWEKYEALRIVAGLLIFNDSEAKQLRGNIPSAGARDAYNSAKYLQNE
jgi:hypothetical protein